ncbi:MAG TPA: EAL domain-containing protein [Burkholderiales bacterium]|nr:EAL domain-containing protein [Burkholderiales bacterium]
MKLLIVDDHATNLKLLRLQLEAAGHTVVEAVDGVDALQVLEREAVDGVVSDILMPRMDGYRLCLEVRRRERFAAVPFVLYTSTYDTPADRALAASAGADAYITKPARPETILEALRAAAKKPPRPRVTSDAAGEIAAPVLKQYSEALVRKLEVRNLNLARTHEGLVEAEARLSGLIETAIDGIIAIDEEQKIILFNSAASRIFACPQAAAMGRPLNDFIPQRYRAAHTGHIKAFAHDAGNERHMGAREVYALRHGTEFPIEASISKLDTSRGRLYTVFVRDVTERKRAETNIRRLNRVYAVLSGINTLIVRAQDRDELFREACRIAVEVGGLKTALIGMIDAQGKTVQIVARAGGTEDFFAQAEVLTADTVHGSGAPALAIQSLQPVVYNNIAREAMHTMTPQMALDAGFRSMAVLPLVVEGKAVGVLSLHAAEADFFSAEEMALLRELAGDIAFAIDHLAKIHQLNYVADYDLITGLPNRRLFTERLSQRVEAARGKDEMLAVVLIDLERFRRINETLGRTAGDELLRIAGERLKLANSTAARLGVDMFAFKVMDRRSAADVARAFEEISARCFGPPFKLAGQELRIGCRGGVAVFPGDGDDAETLLRNAEAALRRAKAAAEHCVFYAPAMNARAAEALATESKLRLAIERREFVLHYQPKVDFAGGRICGAEALIRWQSPERGLVPPLQFIPILEESGLIGAVGEWALGQALADARRWRAAGFPLRVAVNVSPLQLRRPDFAALIAQVTAEDGAALLELEITESVIMEDVDRNVVVLKQIRDMGVMIAIDDFGTGYSSLAYIAKLPVTSLKIDRAFVIGMTKSPEGMAIVSSIVALAHALNLRVIAEGVETEEQARLLRLLRCDETQGYLYSKAVPSTDMEALMAAGGALAVRDPV